MWCLCNMMDMCDMCMCMVCAYIHGICCVHVSAMLYICICTYIHIHIYGMCLKYNAYVISACVWYMACLCNVCGAHAHGMYYICDMFVHSLCVPHTHMCDCGVCSVCGP